jgi:putative transposase
LADWLHWLLTTHACRYNRHHELSGHVWQGRSHTFPIQEDEHLLSVLRYVERNPLRANLVARAEDWLWSSLRERLTPVALPWLHPGPTSCRKTGRTMSTSPTPRPNWRACGNQFSVAVRSGRKPG